MIFSLDKWLLFAYFLSRLEKRKRINKYSPKFPSLLKNLNNLIDLEPIPS